MVTGSVRNFLMWVGIDVKFLLPKVPLSKATGHTSSTFQNYRLENKLLQELDEEIDIIISNTVQLKIRFFLIFIWEEQHQLKFVTTIVWKSTTIYHLNR